MPTQLHIKWPDEEVSEVFSSLRFSRKFNVLKKDLYCAEIDPPLKIGTEKVKYIHFIDFYFLNNEFIFFTPNEIRIDLPTDLTSITFTIISPKPAPLRDDWNTALASTEDDCFVQVFYYSQNTETSENHVDFLTTLKSKWNTISSDIESLLKTTGYGTFGLSIGIVQKAFEVPELEAVDTFFSSPSSYKKGSKIMVVVISSFEEFTLNYKGRILFTKGIPTIPRDLLLRKVKMIVESNKDKEPIDKPSRRLLKSLFNGGIPSNLFAKYPNLLRCINEDGFVKYFEEGDFGKTVLNLDFLDSEDIDYTQILRQPLDSLKHHLFNTSNEATLRSLFWDPVLNQLFLYGQEERDKRYRLSSEWKTRKLLPHLEDRKIDYEASIKPGTKRHSILLVETGTESFDGATVHKDFSKLIGAMSLCCITMARDLLRMKKTPENARIYGIWIGELKIQFCVAHPVLTKLEDGTYEVHSEITYEDDWFFDLLSGVIRESTPPATESQLQMESIKKGRISQQGHIYSNFSFDENESKYVSGNFDSEEQPRIPVKIESQPIKVIKKDDAEISLHRRNVNFVAIRKLHAFIEIIKKRIDFIMDEDENPDEMRKLSPESYFGYIDAAPLPSQISKTAADKKRQFYGKMAKNVQKPKFKMTKNSMKELEILWKLSLFPDYFAKIYSAEVNEENGSVDYEFEKMLPIVNSISKKLSCTVSSPNPWDSMYLCLKFAVQCLMALHVLHENVGIVHSDISSCNIMFSFQDDCWKIIDFNQSLEIEDSLKTTRFAGTNGFIAPESKETGIFSPKSDIYSLGKLIIDYLNCVLIQQILLDETEQVGSELRILFNGFNRISLSMISTDPNLRPSAIQALDKMFDLFKYFVIDDEKAIYIAIKNTLALYRATAHKEFKEKAEILNITKKLKISEEKEQNQSALPLSIQKNIN